MEWAAAIADFRTHLKLERSLSDRTVAAYVSDLSKLRRFAEESAPPLRPQGLQLEDLHAFVTWAAKSGLNATSQRFDSPG